MMKKLLILLIVMACLRIAWKLPMEDELQCGLADGSKFVLTSAYSYSWIAAHLVPHSQSVSNRKDFSVKFKPKKTMLTAVEWPKSVKYRGMLFGTKGTCKNFYFTEGKYHAFHYVISGTDGSAVRIQRNGLIGLSITETENSQEISDALISKNLTPIYESFFSETKGGYVFEQALTSTVDACNSRLPTDEQCKIVAVARSLLLKDSQTWTLPIITADANIFELGKSIYEQSFIARPISINGEKIDVNFPK